MPLPGKLLAPCLDSAATAFLSAGVTFCVPRTTMALSFLLPMTAPTPVRPQARLLIFMMAAKVGQFFTRRANLGNLDAFVTNLR
jgi:hypothetical protein